MLELLYPQVCGICGEKINQRYTCRKCLNILEYYQEMECAFGLSKIYFDQLLCLFPYKGILKSKMLQLKFYGYKYIARTFGDILAHKIEAKSIHADFIIPVPVSKKRNFERGFNQSECIAKYLAELTKIPLKNKFLEKTKNNFTQSTLSSVERIGNVKGVYTVPNKEEVLGKTIILLDDIYTTGATMNECARVLKCAGASTVIAVTFLYSMK